MTDLPIPGAAAAPRPSRKSLLVEDARMKRRNAAEKRFELYGLAAIVAGVLALVILLASILGNGLSSFRQTFVTFPVPLVAETIEAAEASIVKTSKYRDILAAALIAKVEEGGSMPQGMDTADVAAILSGDAPSTFRDFLNANPQVIGTTREFEFLANGRIDGFFKGRVTAESAVLDGNVTPDQLIVARALTEAGTMETRFNWDFFTNADASDQRPEAAGLGVAILGSLYMMLVVLVLALPIGVAASIYLEEFAPRNRITDVIEVNISNLAAVPSIVFGLLGLAVFINFFSLPRSAPLVGGIVLSLMTLPTIIIASRAALKSVPPSIREAARGLGASDLQVVFHHVLPLAMPGILTGTIIGLAQALGETAPLLMIGMVAFIVDVPQSVTDSATVLPVQVYLWADSPERAFTEKTSAAIMVLLAFLIAMNAVAVLLRKRFERRW